MKRWRLLGAAAVLGAAGAGTWWHTHRALLEAPAAREPGGEVARRVFVARTPPDGAWREAYARASNDADRVAAFQQAAREASAEAVNWLATMAEADRSLGAKAAVALGGIDDPAAAAQLTAIAGGNGSAMLRANAVHAVGNARGLKASSSLAGWVADRTQPLRVRQEAALALARTGDPSVVSALVGALDEATSDLTADAEQLRIALIQALAGIRSAEAREALKRFASRSPTKTEAAFLARSTSQM